MAEAGIVAPLKIGNAPELAEKMEIDRESLEVKPLPVVNRKKVVLGTKKHNYKYWNNRTKIFKRIAETKEIKKSMLNRLALAKRIKFLEEACADLEEKIKKLDED